jgi:hypothetical protein
MHPLLPLPRNNARSVAWQLRLADNQLRCRFAMLYQRLLVSLVNETLTGQLTNNKQPAWYYRLLISFVNETDYFAMVKSLKLV